MDALTDIIRLLRPRTVLLGRMAAGGDWGVLVPPQPGPTFYVVSEGQCWFTDGSAPPVLLEAGDVLLSARPRSDRFFSRPGVATPFSDTAYKAIHSVDGELRLGDPDAPIAVRKLGGLILCNPANAGLLIGLLPAYTHVHAGGPGALRLHTVIDLIRDEADATRPGRDAVLARLIEVLLVEVLRHRPTWSPQPGVLAALSDPQLGRALADIHADVARSWTVEALARRAGMSRAVFARRFAATVGAAPLQYLLRWRMALAKDALQHDRSSLEQVAVAVGYKSASAFSAAFARRVGCPPSEYAARASASEAAG